MTSRPEFFDVRMRGFRDRADVAHVVSLIAHRVQPLPAETAALRDGHGRVLAADIVAEFSVPMFDRSAMDGYALQAEETFGANPYNPLEFRIVGTAFPGTPFVGILQPGQAVRVMTGAPLPHGADAVLPVEATEEIKDQVRVKEPVTPGKHVGRLGEDIQAGSTVLHAGRVLRPQDLGILASIGVAHIAVIRRPKIDVLITGNELLPCGERPYGCRIIDSNSVMLEALVQRDGGLGGRVELLPDTRSVLECALDKATGDAVLISGGSSVGQEDHAPDVLAALGELVVHGVALRPASPCGVGFLGERPVFLLPGNPVSCLCGYDFFAGPAIRRLGGLPLDWAYRRHKLPLARKIVSEVGRVDYVRVRIHEGQIEPLTARGAALLSSTTRADGFVIVPRDSEGVAPGEETEVFLYDG